MKVTENSPSSDPVTNPRRTGILLAVVKILDPSQMTRYREVAEPLMAAAGGTFVVDPANARVLEGDLAPGEVLVASAWESADAARAFWSSPAYRAAIRLRTGACLVTAVAYDLVGTGWL